MVSSKTKNNKVGKQHKDFLSSVTHIAKLSLVGNQEYVPEPPLLEEKRKIYQSQVLIPLTITGKTHMYMGHLPDPNVDAKKLKKFFPTYHCTKPLASKLKIDDQDSVKNRKVYQSKLYE